ncbi:MAG: DoxX family protein [Pseudomonadota bacterium]|nr:DoxX family protein [Pseudomonadota bacterium]
MAISTIRAGAARESGGDVGLLILRLVLGGLILLHGLAKLPPPPAFITSLLVKLDLPTALAYGVYLGEIVGPVLIIIGIWTRLGALLIVGNMLFAVMLAHTKDLFHLGPQGGYALELQAMYLFTALALVLLGAGRFSLGGRLGPMN